jgi:hypothetical protein
MTTREVNAERADQPSDPHHVRFAQPRALGLKDSDKFTVPLCRVHHRELYRRGNEVAWWEGRRSQAARGCPKALAGDKLWCGEPYSHVATA